MLNTFCMAFVGYTFVSDIFGKMFLLFTVSVLRVPGMRDFHQL